MRCAVNEDGLTRSEKKQAQILSLLHTVFDPVCELANVAMITVGPSMAKKMMNALRYADELWDGPPMCSLKLNINWHMPGDYICYHDSSGRVLHAVHCEEQPGNEEGSTTKE